MLEKVRKTFRSLVKSLGRGEWTINQIVYIDETRSKSGTYLRKLMMTNNTKGKMTGKEL